MSKHTSRGARSRSRCSLERQPRLPLPSRQPSASTRYWRRSSCTRFSLARSNTHPGGDDDPGFIAAVREEEAAIQALGDMIPATVAGAAAQLAYMASIEGSYIDDQSPILRTMRTVAKALAAGGLA